MSEDRGTEPEKMKQGRFDGFATQEVQPEDTVQNLARVDTGAEVSDNRGRDTGSSMVEQWKPAKGKLKSGVR